MASTWTSRAPDHDRPADLAAGRVAAPGPRRPSDPVQSDAGADDLQAAAVKRMLAGSPRWTSHGAATSPRTHAAGRPAGRGRPAPDQVLGTAAACRPAATPRADARASRSAARDRLAARDRPDRHRDLDQLVDPAGGRHVRRFAERRMALQARAKAAACRPRGAARPGRRAAASPPGWAAMPPEPGPRPSARPSKPRATRSSRTSSATSSGVSGSPGASVISALAAADAAARQQQRDRKRQRRRIIRR